MTFDEYQGAAMETAIYPHRGFNLPYVTMGLVGEAGEIANEVKKVQRDDRGELTSERRDRIIDELGDVLWYCAMLAEEAKIGLEYVAAANLAKLKARHGK